MGLTANTEMELIDAGLVQFYGDHIAEYREIAQRSYEFAEANVLSTGLPVRPDDVAVHIVPALEIDEGLREFLAGRKLRQKFWYRRFADLMLDRLWGALSRSDEVLDGSDQKV